MALISYLSNPKREDSPFSQGIVRLEETHYPLGHARPVEALGVLMENRKLRQLDLIPVLGASSVISDILNGKRSISKTHARKPAEFFHVPVSLFI